MKYQTKTVMAFLLLLLVGASAACGCYLKTHQIQNHNAAFGAQDHDPCQQDCSHCGQSHCLASMKSFDLEIIAVNASSSFVVPPWRSNWPFGLDEVSVPVTAVSWHDPPTPTPFSLGTLLLI